MKQSDSTTIDIQRIRSKQDLLKSDKKSKGKKKKSSNPAENSNKTGKTDKNSTIVKNKDDRDAKPIYE